MAKNLVLADAEANEVNDEQDRIDFGTEKYFNTHGMHLIGLDKIIASESRQLF